MRRHRKEPLGSARVARLVRERIEQGGERVWRLEDFQDLPFSATARALSRLAHRKVIERLSKGVYYRARPTAFGASRPNPATISKLASDRKDVFPSGISAANLLGFTTQTARRGEVATSAGSLPRKLLGLDTVIHTRRPEAWSALSAEDAALLDFLRSGGKASELPPEQTVQRTLALLSQTSRFHRLLRVAATEPPRARAVIGALGEQLGIKPAALKTLRASLNPLSRFDFGVFAALPNATDWQARKKR
ncbi:MAG: DUF6088 family protein [Vicinamibacterales bacterium]